MYHENIFFVLTFLYIEETEPLLQMVFHYISKVKKFKLSKEAKAKSDKNRSK